MNGLTLNNRYFKKKQLIVWCENLLQDNTKPLWGKNIAEFLIEWFGANEFINVTTSGSTGKAKTIQLSKEYLVNSAKRTGDFFNLKNGDTALLCLPVKYIAGKMMLVRAIVLKLNILTIPPDSNPLNHLKENTQIDFAAMIPLQLTNSLNNLESLQKISKLMIGGGHISNILIDSIQELNVEVYETYGMTETASHIALKKLCGNVRQDFFKTLPGININTDNRSCLVIKETYSKNRIITNDIVRIINKQEFQWIGRYDNVINSGGIKINPEVIESRIGHLFNNDFFITSISDVKLGNKIVLLVEKEQLNAEEKVTLIESLNSILSKYEMPKDIIAISNIVRTKSGKINRNGTKAILDN